MTLSAIFDFDPSAHLFTGGLRSAQPSTQPCSSATLVVASGILLQFLQQFGRDPSLGLLRLVDDFPALVVLPALAAVERHQRIKGSHEQPSAVTPISIAFS